MHADVIEIASRAAAAAEKRIAQRALDDTLDGTDVLRLVDDEADGCAGIVIDRYGSVIRVEARGSSWSRAIDDVARAVCRVCGVGDAVGLLRTSGGKSEMRVLLGDPPRAHVVVERGVRLLVRTVDEDAAGTGVFVDHRLGRALVAQHARGARVLNLFAHAGAFGAVAVAAGAARVDHVDAAKKCAPWAAVNVALNGVDPRAHRFLVEDALAFVKKAAKKGPGYDVVVCDPPTTALRPDGSRFHVERDLPELARDCFACANPGALVLLSTNDRALGVDDVAAIARAAGAAKVSEIPLPADVATRSDAQLRPMRGVACIARGA
jgi:23S rRNA (cytosine1962-C5)-methyltransferase